jgi:hypothetical protein
MISKTKVSTKYFDGMHCRLSYQGGIMGVKNAFGAEIGGEGNCLGYCS